MHEVKDLFEMTTRRVELDVDPWLEQQHRQSKARRNERLATFAVVAVLGLLVAVAWVVGTREGHKARRPADQPRSATPTPSARVATFPVGADRVGLVGLAPAGAEPSQPERGELVLGFTFGHTAGDPGRYSVFVYADGRLIWQRLGDLSGVDEYSKDYTTGFLEQRLTPAGVELVRAEALSTGLFDRDRYLTSQQRPNFGLIDIRTGDRLVHVEWGDVGNRDVTPEIPTPEQVGALQQLDARLENPASWLPASAWADPKLRAFVPSGYSVCYNGRKELGQSQVLAFLPPEAGDLLLTHHNTRRQAPEFVFWCTNVTNEEARTLAGILDDAGLAAEKDEFGVRYDGGRRAVWLDFAPLLPHDV